MSERRLNTDSVRSLVWSNHGSKDLIACARWEYDVCLPTAVYCIARKFDQNLWDLDMQCKFLEELAWRPDHGFPNLEDTWSNLISLFDRFSLRVKRCISTQENLDSTGAIIADAKFPIQIVDDCLPGVTAPALFMLANGDKSHAVALLDNSRESVRQFNLEAQRFPTPGMVFELEKAKRP